MLNGIFWLPVSTLCRRELLRFWRQKARVAGFLGSPLIFWLVLGSGFGNLAFFYPGAVTLTVMFFSVFSMMSLIEDRREGFLLSMLVSPAPRCALVFGKILGAGLLAWLQGILFLAFLPMTGFAGTLGDVAAAAGVLGLIAFLFTALGFLFAWRIDSTQGFHAIMNLVLFPLWMVSGALFSSTGAHTWMQWLMMVNPLTYPLAALRQLLDAASAPAAPGLALSVTLTAVLGLALWVAATLVAGRPEKSSTA